MITARQVKRGHILNIENELYRVMEVRFLNPGNWRAMTHIKMRSLKSGNQMEKRYGSDEKFEKAILESRTAQYLYQAEGEYYFMDQESFEQFTLTDELLGDAIQLLLPETEVQLVVHDGTVVGVELPKVVELTVTETQPALKGATAQAQYKPATMETGVVIQVPHFIEAGEVIRIDTENLAYVERKKD